MARHQKTALRVSCLSGAGSLLGVVLRFVPRVDLAGAVLLGLGLAGYDIWAQLKPRR